ncbi:uncharacterized protein LOC120836519 [Ixodes scapularis]|uniref:uncharacterized protein LOC120836519 n=1 Tax=Ixodes scapularis TaxID=6945 RepID=UPI001C38EFDB|nr:uncharacterized protein LOC120836519 [Ixodes scapularis]
MCSPPTNECRLGDCGRCPKDSHFTLERLGIPEEAEILVAAWESGNLIKKSLDSMTFMNELQTLVGRWIPHNQIRSIQGKAIYTEKLCEEKGSLVLHFDFAENWTVVLPDEVQAYHWHKKQVSVFTCVATTRKSTRSFAVISDDVCHDSAHACCAIGKITDWLDDNAPVHSQVTFVSDGAASHFKNKYQLHEFRKLEYPAAKWLFSATGHGKNACDGVGGLVKHQATLDNLRQPASMAIQNGQDMSRILSQHLKGVKLLYLDETELVEFRNRKKEEWSNVRAVRGIQKWHVWRSRRTGQNSELTVFRTAESATTITIS